MDMNMTEIKLAKEQKKCRERILRYFRKHYDTRHIGKLFPQTRKQRVRKIARSKSLGTKNVYSWMKGGCDMLVRSSQYFFEKIHKTPKTKSVLRSRLHIGRFNAGMMYNQVMKITSNYGVLREILGHENVSPVDPTYIVLVDTTRNKTATEHAIQSVYFKKSEHLGVCRLQTRVPSETVSIPTIKINFKSILDRPKEANKSLFGSKNKNQTIFADRDGINTASLQILDRYLSDAKKMKGEEYKMIVLHDNGLLFEDVKDFVHCSVSDFVATVASRVVSMNLDHHHLAIK